MRLSGVVSNVFNFFGCNCKDVGEFEFVVVSKK